MQQFLTEGKEINEDNMNKINNILEAMIFKVKKEEKKFYKDKYCAFIRKTWYNLPGAENCLPTDYKCIDCNYDRTVVEFATCIYKFFFFNAEIFQRYNYNAVGKFKHVFANFILLKYYIDIAKMIKRNHFYTKRNKKRKSPPDSTSQLIKEKKDFDRLNTRLHLNRNLQVDDENNEPNSLETPKDSQETSDSERQVIKYLFTRFFQNIIWFSDDPPIFVVKNEASMNSNYHE